MTRKKLGIDAGGSLIKIVIEEGGRFHYKWYPIGQLKQSAAWMAIAAQGAKVSLTGGKALFIRQHYFPEAEIVPEFTAVCSGAAFLLKQSGETALEKYLIANIGTGTSWYLVDAQQHQRVLGSGLGGGTFMGLANLLAGQKEFSEYVTLASSGNKGKVDLLVQDIYEEAPPIDGSLTASNFAKAAYSNGHSYRDRLAAAINMLAENLVLLSKQTAAIHQTDDIVYIGSTLTGNQPLQAGLELYSSMLGLHPHTLRNGEYSGALGAILST
ncbi:pantothenate kinase [Mesobacillus campisalis]|uniref:Pantothenate kinase n=1 Tax=Mesobacillus campisalis TaxID=1408103 RepID=A0A0M2SXQ6_9BACI|nr:pantothenate kinase [Mesobacillus campisalis]KKK38491.1 pantothenate kinase [Mesobacillus campisalis]